MMVRIRQILKNNLISKFSLIAQLLTVIDNWLNRSYFNNGTDYDKSIAPDIKAVLTQLSSNGYAIIPNFMTPESCKSAITELEEAFSLYPDYLSTQSDIRLFVDSFDREFPNINLFKESSFLNNVFALFLKEKASILATLLNKVESINEKNKGSGEGWHRDSLYSQIKAICYLSDVDETCGPFEFLVGSHTLKSKLDAMRTANLKFRQHRYTDFEVNQLIRSGRFVKKAVVAKAGTIILINTSVIHRGRPIQDGKVRYALTHYVYPNQKIGEVRSYILKKGTKLLGYSC